MRPARESCEKCHFPEKFSDDSLRELKEYSTDKFNTSKSTFIVLKTGGGAKRQGLGRGIHWHIENPIYYYATDPEKQNIPYVKVVNEDGTITEYVDLESNFDPDSIDESKLEQMDCITCHNFLKTWARNSFHWILKLKLSMCPGKESTQGDPNVA